jgi:protein-S-isoprenylcysteine O-methyltransferase Ste14
MLMADIGRFMFRYRNGLLPLMAIALLVWRGPDRIDQPLDSLTLVVGLAIAFIGQALRIITIGWQYIERGGKDRTPFASRLVTGGMYAYCRNAMYVGNIMLGTGFMVATGVPAHGVIAFVVLVFIYQAIVRAEEDFLRNEFKEEYAQYCARVPRWGVRIVAMLGDLGRVPLNWTSILIREYGTFSVSILCAVLLVAWRVGFDALTPGNELVLAAIAVAAIVFALVVRVLKKSRRLYVPR